MKKVFTIFGVALLLATFTTASAQTQKEDGTWWDNELVFKVVYEDLDSTAELIICIENERTGTCVENLSTGFQVSFYDASNNEIWNSLWTGKNLDLIFKKSFPDAKWILIKANKNYVVNTMTGTRIYQDKPLSLKYILK